VSDEFDDITREIVIAARPETVFDFLIDPALMRHWIGVVVTLDPRPGGLFQVEISAGNIARGSYTAVVRPRHVAFTWGWETHADGLAALEHLPPGASLVEIDLMPQGNATLLRLRHSRVPRSSAKLHEDRWSAHLARLQAAAGEPAKASSAEI
jgi:uncharacterized protein YndB with AHSA1/START domain